MSSHAVIIRRQPYFISGLFFIIALFFWASASIAGPAGHASSEDKAPTAQSAVTIDQNGAQTALADEGATINEEETPKEHPHWGSSPDSSTFSKVASYFGKFHPLLVHFPIALFLTAALAQFLLLIGVTPNFTDTVRFLVWLATASIVVAAAMGWGHAGPPVDSEGPVMVVHRVLGTSMVVLAFLTVWFMERAKKRSASKSGFLFNALLFTMALSVAVNGFLGGALAHGGLKHLLPGFG